MKIHSYLWLSLLMAIGLSSCIGTDLIDELVGPDLSRLELDRQALSVKVGETTPLSASFYGHSGEPESANLQWSSKNENIARIDGSGNLVGVAIGQTEILVIANSRWRDSVLVTVVSDPNAVATVEIGGPNPASVTVGDSVSLQAVVRNASGTVLSGKTIQWRSSAPTIAAVNSRGLVRGLAQGQAAITATVEGVNSPVFGIEVKSAGGAVRSGTFSGQNGYSASGGATLVREGSSFLIQLEENFRTQTGPGLAVYLSQAGNRATNAVDLGALKATSGKQSYAIPANINVAEYSHVLIYCVPFRVVFASAELK